MSGVCKVKFIHHLWFLCLDILHALPAHHAAALLQESLDALVEYPVGDLANVDGRLLLNGGRLRGGGGGGWGGGRAGGSSMPSRGRVGVRPRGGRAAVSGVGRAGSSIGWVLPRGRVAAIHGGRGVATSTRRWRAGLVRGGGVSTAPGSWLAGGMSVRGRGATARVGRAGRGGRGGHQSRRERPIVCHFPAGSTAPRAGDMRGSPKSAAGCEPPITTKGKSVAAAARWGIGGGSLASSWPPPLRRPALCRLPHSLHPRSLPPRPATSCQGEEAS